VHEQISNGAQGRTPREKSLKEKEILGRQCSPFTLKRSLSTRRWGFPEEILSSYDWYVLDCPPKSIQWWAVLSRTSSQRTVHAWGLRVSTSYMSWGTRCGTGLPARNSPMVGTSVPVPGILSHDISFHTHLPGLSIVLGFNLQHRMGRWSQEGSVRHVGNVVGDISHFLHIGGDFHEGNPRVNSNHQSCRK